MKVDLAQIDIEQGIKDKNLVKAVSIIQDSSADLILFPELFTTGFEFENINQLSENIPGETTKRIVDVCEDSIVGGTILEKDDEKIYNTFVIINKEGVVAKYRKIHLFGEEKKHFKAGVKIKTIDFGFGKATLATCYDIRFPELFRESVRQKAEIVLVSAEFPDPREDHWRTLLRARAIENQCFIIATNRIGEDSRQSYFGGSMIVDPWGETIISGGREESILKADIDIRRAAAVRSSFPVLDDVLDDYNNL